MESHRSKTEVAVGIFLLIIAIKVDSVQSRTNLTNDVKPVQAPIGTVKTIQGLSGDLVDCVDIYKQPAFDHPLLKNHTIQMKPSFQEEGENHLQGLPAELEGWGIDCPEGTVPIARFHMDKESLTNKSFPVLYSTNGHEYATVNVYDVDGTFQGGRAIHNVWNPHVESRELSISQIWIIAGSPENLNSVEAGWIVGYQSTHATRFFTYWTPNGYKSGCYNLLCPGFVQTSRNFAPGFYIPHISKYGGKQFKMDIQIRRDQTNGNWWVILNDMNVGYWPSSLFNALHPGGRSVQWGGEITNRQSLGHHTMTQMGSGHLPREGYFTKSSFIANLAYIKHNGPMEPVPRDALKTYATNTHCYDVVIGQLDKNFGTHFYFGGPGFSSQCP